VTAAKRKQDTKTSFKILKMFFSQKISVRDLSALPRNEQDQDCRSQRASTGVSPRQLVCAGGDLEGRVRGGISIKGPSRSGTFY
jgi:hypothetical protein